MRHLNLQLDAGGDCESGDEKDMQLHAKNGLARPKLLLYVRKRTKCTHFFASVVTRVTI